MNPHPDIFYKYLAPDTASAVLTSGRLRWSSPLLFDDEAEFRRMPRFDPPVDVCWPLSINAIVDAAAGRAQIDIQRLGAGALMLYQVSRLALSRGVTEDELRDANNAPDISADTYIATQINQWVESLDITTARVQCLSIEADNAELWRRYAASHSGAVLGFRRVQDRSTPLLAARKVEYSERPPVVGSGLDFLLYGDTPELRRRAFEAIFFAKEARWSAQREWRVVTWRSGERGLFGDYRFAPDELVSVSCGSASSDDFRLGMQALLNAKYPSTYLDFVPQRA